MNTVDCTKFGNIADTGDFSGSYVVDMKRALITAVVTGQHLMLVGKPGCGKTSVSKSVFEQAFDGRSVFVRFSPTTEPEAVTGVPNPRKIYEDGLYEFNTQGTVSDPEFKGMILDEFQRTNDAVLELMMQRLDRNGMPDSYNPVAVATVNWIPKGERMAAPIDRFAMMMAIKDEQIPTREIALKMLVASTSGRSQLKDCGGGIPDLDTIMEVRNAVPTKSSLRLVADFLDDFVKGCIIGLTNSSGETIARFIPNNRRIEQWANILMRMSIYFTGQEDFTSIPAQAKECLKFAWVSQDLEQISAWESFVNSGTIDPIDSIIAVMMEQTFIRMDQMYQSGLSDQVEMSKSFGQFVRQKAREIADALVEAGLDEPEDDPRYVDAMKRIKAAFVNASSGRSPLDGGENG